MAVRYQRLLATGILFLASCLHSVSHAEGLARPASDIETTLQQNLLEPPSDSSRYRFRSWIRERVVCESDLARYGLDLDSDWQQADANKPLVILLHGFNSCADNNEEVLASIRMAGFPCGSFSYPNDHSLTASAQRLAFELRRFADLHPERRITLVCHSMGGLVARACLEDPFYDPGNVDQLIMIAPPTHGTLLARFAVGTDIWEHWIARKKGKPWTRVRDSIVDGLGEAADDLCPDSEFLTELNSRPRNPRVRYSIFLGTGALMSHAQVEWIRESVSNHLAKLPGGDTPAARLDAILEDIDELVDGKGDGVVAVKRGRLKGVDDTVILPFGHLAVTGKAGNEIVIEVHRAVVARIE